MNPVFEKIPGKPGESFFVEELRAESFGTPWHFHPELELTLTLQANGYRMVGDAITPLMAGDLVLVGANLPHVWHEDWRRETASRVHAVVVQFRDDFLGREFLARPEAQAVGRLFQRAARGLQVNGALRRKIGERVRGLVHLDGMPRLLELVAILHELAQSSDLTPLATLGYVPETNRHDEARMNRVCDYINQHLDEVLERDQLARIANLSAGAFSRFFKARTGRTLPEYINELRLGRACRQLANPNLSITEVAMACGFQNLSHFNAQFRRRHKVTPRDFRKRIAASL
jgi:AraC-like DNA-binding protein